MRTEWVRAGKRGEMRAGREALRGEEIAEGDTFLGAGLK